MKKPSPLIRVLAQIRWKTLAGFDVGRVADAVAPTIGLEYPLRGKTHEAQLIFAPGGITPQSGPEMHTFTSADGNWIVTLASTFITLETTAYKSHEDFIPKFVRVAAQVRQHLPLKRWERFGYRYTNRIVDAEDIGDLEDLFNPAVLGTVGFNFPDAPFQTVGESIYQSPGPKIPSLLVKSALLPPQAVMEPTIPPVLERSWLLDLDAYFMEASDDFENEELERRATVLSERAHAYFESVTSEEFRRRFDV